MSLRPREERKMRLDLLVRKLRGVPESKLKSVLAWVQFEWGVSKRVGVEYLEVLQDIEMISVDEELDIIFWKGKT